MGSRRKSYEVNSGYEDDHLEMSEPSGYPEQKSGAEEQVSGDVFPDTKQIWRNTLVICFGFMFLFTSFQALSALQSSLFINEGMGTTVLATIYGSLIVSTFFLPTPTISILGCKWTLAIAMSCYIFFMVAHFYATWGLFIPAAIILGLGAAPLWTAKGQYLNIAAHDYAKKKGITNDGATNLFFGVFFLCFQTTSVWGNIISSQVLSSGRSSNESLINPLSAEELSFCGAGFCPSDAQSSNNTNLGGASDSQMYMLAGIYTACGCLAVLLIIIFLQQLPTELGRGIRCTRDKCNPRLLVATFLHMKDHRQILMIPLTMYSGLEQAFLTGDFTQSFITCPLGSWWVGYVLICYGVCDAICSFTFGRLVTYVGRMPFFILGAAINLSLLIAFLLFEVTQDQLYVYFIFAGLWGVADAVWQTQINALYGVLFKESGEAAFSNYRLWESLGFLAAFIYQSRLCFPIKAYILIAVLVIGMVCYSIVEIRERQENTAH